MGLLLDSNLNFKLLREKLYKKVTLKIRKYIDVSMAKTIYKSTILPILEYADFVYDHDIKYVNKKLQGLQNKRLSVVYNQYIILYYDRDSTETLHRKAKVFRLCYHRRLHLLSFAYRLSKNDLLLHVRDIHTRMQVGKLFWVCKIDHFRSSQDPTYRAMIEWNQLPVAVRSSISKNVFLENLKSLIPNPYMKVL